jgi:hypothetical protein
MEYFWEALPNLGESCLPRVYFKTHKSRTSMLVLLAGLKGQRQRAQHTGARAQPRRHDQPIDVALNPCGTSIGLIIQSLALENLRRAFFNPCRPGFGLFGRRKIEQVCSLPSRRQRLKRVLQAGNFL